MSLLDSLLINGIQFVLDDDHRFAGVEIIVDDAASCDRAVDPA